MDSSNGQDYDSLDVAVVGAGPAGLCLARRLAGTDASFAVFERNGDVGGVWDIDAPGSPMYESAHFISSKTLSGFPGFPMPDRYPDYPNHRQILDYIRSYADRSDPSRLHTRSTSCTPDPDADKSMWLRFLNTTFGGDADLIGYLQRLVGYSAVGLVGAHVLPYCHGSGGNGKGVYLETCVKVLGGYATTAPAGFLMAKTHASHETEIARLAGARMVLCSEVNDDDRFDEARVKLLTGGDTLTARFMQQDHFTFTPTHQLWAMGNHQPHVRAGGRSFWRRLRLIPFAHEVPASEIIDDLQGILAGEHGPAVLAWIIEGAVAYHREGLKEPDAVKAATGEYAHDQDTVARFVDEMCHIGGGDQVTIKMAKVRSAYEAWCHESGDEPVTAKAFGIALRRHGVGVTRTKTAKMYVGLTLLSDEEESVTSEGGWYR